MPFTTREIDHRTRYASAAADAALREPEQHDIGEKMVLNMGPSIQLRTRLRLVLSWM